MDRLCDENCNECPLVNHRNNRQLSLLLNLLNERFGDDVCAITNEVCPNFTVCFDCRIDDFVHLEEGCAISKHEAAPRRAQANKKTEG